MPILGDDIKLSALLLGQPKGAVLRVEWSELGSVEFGCPSSIGRRFDSSACHPDFAAWRGGAGLPGLSHERPGLSVHWGVTASSGATLAVGCSIAYELHMERLRRKHGYRRWLLGQLRQRSIVACATYFETPRSTTRRSCGVYAGEHCTGAGRLGARRC